MANGGWYGSFEEWERVEAPLIAVDPVFENFALETGCTVSRNQKSWPERSIRWENATSNLIQLYLADEEALTWHLWIAASQDRDLERYWKQARLVDNQPLSGFRGQLPRLLVHAHEVISGWSQQPECLDLAGPIEPLV